MRFEISNLSRPVENMNRPNEKKNRLYVFKRAKPIFCERLGRDLEIYFRRWKRDVPIAARNTYRYCSRSYNLLSFK